MERIAEDMQALQAISQRFAGTEGERAALHTIRQRLDGEGWLVRVEGFVAHTRLEHVALAHVVALVVIGIVGVWFPGFCVPPAALVTASLIGSLAGGNRPA